MPRRDAFIKKDLVLEYIIKQVRLNGYPPSVREICSAVGIKSTSTVHLYIEKLIEEGQIEKFPSRPRALKVTTNDFDMYEKVISVPVLGKVAAGTPILASENHEGSLVLPIELTGSGAETFILKVKGDSMIDAGILEGDFIIIRQQTSANNGDVVVAMIEDEVTVKTFYKEKGYIRLQPQNKALSPILVTGPLSILGKVIGVIRKM